MNTAFLLVCSLSLGQTLPDVAGVSVSDPSLDGTYSVLVKVTTLADANMVAAASESATTTPTSPTGSLARDIADVAELEQVPESSSPPQVITPVSPRDGGVSAAAGEAPLSQGTVAPASNTTPASTAEVATGDRPDAAKRWLLSALSPPPHFPLGGASLTLRDALAGTNDRQGQLQIVSAYWQLTVALAKHRFAEEEVDWLAIIVLPENSDAAAGLAAAQATAIADLKAAELDVVSKQYAMAEMVSNGVSNQPVLPTDLPIVGPYRTHFESLFAGRPAPAGLHRIHRVLPLRQAVIDARAAAVDAADKVVSQAESSYAAGELSLDELLRALTDFRSQRHALIAAVRDYNVDIAAYALAVAGSNAGHDEVVSMLIETPPSASSSSSPPPGQTLTTPGVRAISVVTGQPTLATAPAEANPSAVPTPGQDSLPALSEPTTVSPATDEATPPSTGVSPATADSGASAFRDVTPSEPARPEVLVPLTPARYRSGSPTPGN